MPTPEEITRHHDDTPPPGCSPYVPGYLPDTGVEVVEPDPTWPQVYAEVAAELRRALGHRVLALDHVGSTSVPGLAAKPVIDVDLTVADSADEPAWLPRVEDLGYVLVIREPWWQEHRALRRREPRTNLHVFSPGAPEPVRHLIFRDWLREHPDDLTAYAGAKRVAAEQAGAAGEHVMEYNARKEPVIREIYDRAFRAAGLL